MTSLPKMSKRSQVLWGICGRDQYGHQEYNNGTHLAKK